MNDELMSCFTCLRVQLESEMITIFNPARGGQGLQSFKLCIGCVTAIAEALKEIDELKNVRDSDSTEHPNALVGHGLGDGSDSAAALHPGDPERAAEPPPAINTSDAGIESGSEVRTAPGRGRKTRGPLN